jgi:nucleoside-diphosphate-sugar epimerase
MILVTGGTGFLGSHLLYHLVQSGQKVRAIRRKTSTFDILNRVFLFYKSDFERHNRQIEWVEADINDYFALEDCLDGVREVYHAAALVSFQPGEKETMQRINARGTANLVNACLAGSVRKFCHVSSIAALGRAENEQVINEEVTWKSSRRNSNYAVSKYTAELEVWRGMEEGLPAFIVNPSVILGPGEINSGSTRLIKTVAKGLRFYTGGMNGFVDVRDVVKAMMLLMESDVVSERFILSAENLSYQQVFRLIARFLDAPEPRIKASLWQSEFYWRFEFLRGWLSGKKPLVTRETARTANNTYLYDGTKITRTLPFIYITVEDSIRDACSFYGKHVELLK